MSNFEIRAQMGIFQTNIENSLEELEKKHIIPRIWEHDHTVWKPDPLEIKNRLGWLDIAKRLSGQINRILELKNQLLNEGYTQALLLGMGGSSLAPEVFSKTFGEQLKGLDLTILDSTDPDAILNQANRLDPEKTIFIVATKSGGTVETLSLFKFFYNKLIVDLDLKDVGAHFIAITDPNSKLEILANELNFREIFTNDPNIGGRFSVMSYFGLVPAGLVGLDLNELIERTNAMAQSCGSHIPLIHNPGAQLGAVMGSLNQEGLNKVTFVASPGIASFSDWVEQLIAESTGKEGKSILPVVGETLGTPEIYRGDHIFVHLQLGSEDSNIPALQELARAGHPVIHLTLADKYDLGGQFFLWEFATAVAGYFLQINPFDQPNVESAKVLARRMVVEYEETGNLPEPDYTPLTKESLEGFLVDCSTYDYISLQAYVNPTPSAQNLLAAIRLELRNTYKLATTLGFGPRFLHSTGQLHKGDAGHGLFIQFTSEAKNDLSIPDQPGADTSSMSFQTLKISQALGDAAALQAAGRRLIRFHLFDIENLEQLK